MTQKSKWTGVYQAPMQVLNHAVRLRLEKFSYTDLAQIAKCDDIYELELYSNRTHQPVDLSCLAHITALRTLHLERVKFTNLKALKQLPYLRFLIIDSCDFKELDELNGWRALETLFLRRNKLKRFPAGLDLPRIQCLLLGNEHIADLSFAASYPSLKELDVSHNQITDLSSLAACTWLEDLDVGNNSISTLAPLAGQRFKRLRINSTLNVEKIELQLELPEPVNERDALSIEVSRIARLIEAKSWAQVYAIESPDLLGEAFSNVVHGHADAEMVRGALEHPAAGAFEAMIIKGMRPHYVPVLEMLLDILNAYGERLIVPLMQAFQAKLDSPGLYGEFEVGKFKQEHFTIARILQKVAGPAYSDLFRAFFDQRESFSQLHLVLYKWLLDVVGKTQSAQLVVPLIDLLRFERHIIGGDAVFMKKTFKAIGQLGALADGAALANSFDISAETRPDVLKAYQDAITRLGKKKA